MNLKNVRVAWLATHPIQYQTPLLRRIARSPGISLKAIFFSDFSVRSYHDKEFDKIISWDLPMLEGFEYQFLNYIDNSKLSFSFMAPRVPQLKKILNREHFDIVVIQGWNHYGYLLAAWHAQRAGLKVLLRCEATDHVEGSKGFKRLVRDFFLKQLFRRVNCFASIGQHNRNFYLKRGVPESCIVKMPYCVDNDYFREKAAKADIKLLRSELGINDNQPIILYASKLMQRKRADLLLEAYSRLPEPRPWLIFVGDGELRPVLEAHIQKLSINRVLLLGFRNQSILPNFYALADVFVLPSINETWGLVVNEAMNAGCAIIATDHVGCAIDLVSDGDNGFIIKKDDVTSLAQALLDALADRRYITMGKKSIMRIASWGIEQNIQGLQAALSIIKKIE